MRSDLEISLLTEEELDQVLVIEEACFSDPWNREGFLSSMHSDCSMIFAARLDGKIVGYCCLYKLLDEGEIMNVAMAEAFRGRGFAGRLLEAVLKTGVSMGIARFLLDVRITNAAAIHLYEKYGFKVLGRQKDFYENPREDAWLMERLA